MDDTPKVGQGYDYVTGASNQGLQGSSPSQRKARSTKIYKNPKTGEVVETKGGNHKVLKAWKTEFGSDVAERWLK